MALVNFHPNCYTYQVAPSRYRFFHFVRSTALLPHSLWLFHCQQYQKPLTTSSIRRRFTNGCSVEERYSTVLHPISAGNSLFFRIFTFVGQFCPQIVDTLFSIFILHLPLGPLVVLNHEVNSNFELPFEHV